MTSSQCAAINIRFDLIFLTSEISISKEIEMNLKTDVYESK